MPIRIANKNWEKYFFLNQTNNAQINNTMVKYNVEVYLNPKNLSQLINLLVSTTGLVVPNTNNKGQHFDRHGEIYSADLTKNFFVSVSGNLNSSSPFSSLPFRFLGIAVNNNLQKSNIEIRYSSLQNPSPKSPYPSEEFIVNLHLKSGNNNAASAYNAIIQNLNDFHNELSQNEFFNELRNLNLSNRNNYKLFNINSNRKNKLELEKYENQVTKELSEELPYWRTSNP